VPTDEQKALLEAYISVESKLMPRSNPKPSPKQSPKEPPKEPQKHPNPALERFMKRSLGSVRKIIKD
jgi:hypothetical protein